MPSHQTEAEKPTAAPCLAPQFRMRRSEIVGVALVACIPVLGVVGILSPERGAAADLIGRVALIYGLLILGFRALGKRELSQLSPFELVTLLLVAEIVSPALTAGDDSLQGAIIGSATLLTLTFLNSALTYRWRWFRKIGEASPALIIRHGHLLEDALHKDRLRPDEVLSEMHKAGLETISEVKWGFIEPDGTLSFVPYVDSRSGNGDDKALA